jgi:hypothetical protein
VTAGRLGPRPAPLRLFTSVEVGVWRRADGGTVGGDGGRTPPPSGACRFGDGPTRCGCGDARLWRKGFSIGEFLAQLSTVGQAGTHMIVTATRRKRRGRAKLSTAWHTMVKTCMGEICG